jgi:peptidoglycan hydrolase CwlO-like protein
MFNLFKKSKTDDLEKENEQLKEQLADCSKKLIEKQEHINKTNAFWKKKMREVKSSK